MSQEKETKPQNTVKTKKRLIDTVTRWFFATLFVILLILAIVFQVAWKITALFFILTAGLTLLPKSYRKWFYACLGVTVLALIIWVFLPDDNQGWHPYTFDEEAAALNARYAIPDEQNAAIIYEILAETFDGYPDFNIPDDDYTFDELSRKQWTADEYPEYAAWLNKQESSTNELLKATAMDKCSYQAQPFLTYSRGLTDRMSSARRWSKFLNFAGYFYLGDGRRSEALAAYIAAIRLGRHFRQQSNALHKLIGMAIERPTSLNEFVVKSRPVEDELRQIENAIEQLQVDWDIEIASILEYEKLQAKNLLGMFYQINEEGIIRLSHDPLAHIREAYRREVESDEICDPNEFEESQHILRPSLPQKKILKAYTILLWLSAPANPEEAGLLVERYFDKYKPTFVKDYDKDVRHELAYWNKMSSGFFALASADIRHLAESSARVSEEMMYLYREMQELQEMYARGTRILIALRRFKNKNGYWPDHIADLNDLSCEDSFIDPLNNDIFVYKRTDEGFQLYSKGRNDIDEGGRYESVWDANTITIETIHDDRLIWPPKLSSKNKEGADPNDEE